MLVISYHCLSNSRKFKNIAAETTVRAIIYEWPCKNFLREGHCFRRMFTVTNECSLQKFSHLQCSILYERPWFQQKYFFTSFSVQCFTNGLVKCCFLTYSLYFLSEKKNRSPSCPSDFGCRMILISEIIKMRRASLFGEISAGKFKYSVIKMFETRDGRLDLDFGLGKRLWNWKVFRTGKFLAFASSNDDWKIVFYHFKKLESFYRYLLILRFTQLDVHFRLFDPSDVDDWAAIFSRLILLLADDLVLRCG